MLCLSVKVLHKSIRIADISEPPRVNAGIVMGLVVKCDGTIQITTLAKRSVQLL